VVHVSTAVLAALQCSQQRCTLATWPFEKPCAVILVLCAISSKE